MNDGEHVLGLSLHPRISQRNRNPPLPQLRIIRPQRSFRNSLCTRTTSASHRIAGQGGAGEETYLGFELDKRKSLTSPLVPCNPHLPNPTKLPIHQSVPCFHLSIHQRRTFSNTPLKSSSVVDLASPATYISRLSASLSLLSFLRSGLEMSTDSLCPGESSVPCSASEACVLSYNRDER